MSDAPIEIYVEDVEVEKYNWEELVDSYVDEECSEEERLELESFAERDPEVRKAVDDALWIREKIRSLGETSVPDGFGERLQEALAQATVGDESDDDWMERLAEAPADSSLDFVVASSSKNDERGFASKPARVLRAVRNPKFVGAVSASVAGVVVVAAIASLQGPGSGQLDPVDNNVAVSEPKDGGSFVAELNGVAGSIFEKQNWTMTPSPEGTAPKSESKQERQSQYWLKATLGDLKSRTKKAAEFQRYCDELKQSYTKTNVAGEYVLSKVDVATWTKIANWFKNVGTCETSNALTTWSDGTSSETRNVRVAFHVKSSETAEADAQVKPRE